MKNRIILSLGTIVGWSVINHITNVAAPIISGETSVHQLDNSNTGYCIARAGTYFDGSGISLFILGLVLAAIWIPYIARSFKKVGTPLATLMLFGLLTSANATVLDKNTYLSEFKTIKPNQTAFLIPMQGANKSSQGQFDSIAYLDANKVATKRIQIPHVVLDRSTTLANSLSADQYIPSACLYIVGREPYTRMWVKTAERGTSTKDEGTYVETSESINIDFGTVVSAHIDPTNAALYLYHFGVSSALDNGDSPEYPSAVYARSLNDIMDTVVFNDAHRLLANEFGKRTFRQCISQKADIIETVQKTLKETYASYGITIEYFGMASGLNFDQKLQEAVNNVAIAELDASAASNRLASMPVLQTLADIKFKTSAAEALSKWNGTLPALPSFAVIPSGFLESVTGNLFPKK